eukprot:761991-Pleurochrysis_carterae.AAC.1
MDMEQIEEVKREPVSERPACGGQDIGDARDDGACAACRRQDLVGGQRRLQVKGERGFVARARACGAPLDELDEARVEVVVGHDLEQLREVPRVPAGTSGYVRGRCGGEAVLCALCTRFACCGAARQKRRCVRVCRMRPRFRRAGAGAC